MLGVMIDCSRNAVMRVPAVKQYADLLAGMGYDTLMLYTEDTYEVEHEPYFGYMRGRYTRQELKEMDSYCRGKGIELIPCIQTLAHVNAVFQASSQYADVRDCDDILLIDDARTYEMLEHMFATLADCVHTRKIHIGMDEADKVGLGKYLKQNGYADRFELINRHLHRVCEIAGKYGFEPMIWSDMFCCLAGGARSYYEEVELEKIRRKAGLPEKVSLVYWDYYSEDPEHYDKMFRTNQAFDRPVLFAGGAWTWKGFMPDNALSIRTTKTALEACNRHGIEDVFLTMWGDDGAECSRLSVLPALFYAAELKRGNTDMESIKDRFFDLTGMKMDDFLLLDELNALGGKHRYNPSKYLLYNDPLMGLHDWRVSEGDGAYYAALREKLESVAVTTQFQGMFDTAIALCGVLQTKAELGVRTRKAYRKGDVTGLRMLAVETYETVIRDLEDFYHAFSAQWTAENKPFGFDIQDIRIGGLSRRLKRAAQRLLAYADGESDEISELEEELLEETGMFQWTNMATPNVVSHIFFG